MVLRREFHWSGERFVGTGVFIPYKECKIIWFIGGIFQVCEKIYWPNSSTSEIASIFCFFGGVLSSIGWRGQLVLSHSDPKGLHRPPGPFDSVEWVSLRCWWRNSVNETRRLLAQVLYIPGLIIKVWSTAHTLSLMLQQTYFVCEIFMV